MALVEGDVGWVRGLEDEIRKAGEILRRVRHVQRVAGPELNASTSAAMTCSSSDAVAVLIGGIDSIGDVVTVLLPRDGRLEIGRLLDQGEGVAVERYADARPRIAFRAVSTSSGELSKPGATRA
jgi:hypothetical protein